MAAPPVRTVAARTAASASMGRSAFMHPFYASVGKRRESARASFGKPLASTEANYGVDAAAGCLVELDLAFVRGDEPLDDREAQTGAAFPGARTPEAVERPLALRAGH